ncbi:MAG: tRNA (N(6)-L-threonylcarbamoyladenosine(37)-C(2))-methylthiotransferase MtaB [Cytophagales bacterium]|nr:tRNA (N(6)-L-threonylcarbamoyladenosine(37)-C(2))-methylthiotransferase MtaB [Cytophagales bacterium]
MKSIATYTLGCKLNYSETSTLGRQFQDKGYTIVQFQDKADIYLINTCSVTDNADKKCKKVVKEALKYNPNAFIAIVGCYAQLKPQEIVQIPGVDVVLGAAEKFKLLDIITTFEKKTKPEVHHSPISDITDFYCSYSIEDRTRTFLKVQDGCDYSCTFCTIPLARGKSRSDSIENIVKAANDIATDDVKEIVLTGVNIGDFGLQDGKRHAHFLQLIQALDAHTTIPRFRISSIEPNLLTDDIIDFVAQSQRFMPHFHVPLQSGSDKVLRLMRRRYLSSLYEDRVAKLKSAMPHACIGVDVITGFPGESQEDFEITYHFINSLDVSYLHVFTYSERDSTIAKDMPNSVPMPIREARTQKLRELSILKKKQFYTRHLGQNYEVLFENEVKNGQMNGFTQNYIKVTMPYDPLCVNEIINTKLTNSNILNDTHIAENEPVRA